MEKKHPSNTQIIREAIDLMWGPAGGAPTELKESGRAVRQFYMRYRELLAGPIQSTIQRHCDIGDVSTHVPKRIQKLFMDADAILAEKAARRAEWEDTFISGSKEVK